MDIFQPIIDVFDFISSILSTIINGISGVLSIFASILNFLNTIMRILPNPYYPCFLAFISVYGAIFTYKIFRKG